MSHFLNLGGGLFVFSQCLWEKNHSVLTTNKKIISPWSPPPPWEDERLGGTWDAEKKIKFVEGNFIFLSFFQHHADITHVVEVNFLDIFLYLWRREMRSGGGKTNCLSLQNQDSKQLWKYRWQSPAGESLWKSLIESSCQEGWSNQRTCVFQVQRGHVECMINPALGGGGFLRLAQRWVRPSDGQ